MTIRVPRYIPLLALVSEWAEVSGMPAQMVLRRVCEWAVTGAFPEGSFTTKSEDQVAPFDIYMSLRALLDKATGLSGLYLDGSMYSNANDKLGIDTLIAVLVTDHDVLAFCERINTFAPPMLLNGFARFWAQMRNPARHLTPPPCPDAEEHAARISARNHAIDTMNSLRALLAGLRGGRTMFGPRQVDNLSIKISYWEPQWKERRGWAQVAIRRCEDGGLQSELEALDAEWSAFVDREKAASPISTNPPHRERETHANSSAQLARTRSSQKGRGRPSGSGSYELDDAPLVEEMRIAILKQPSLSPTAAANQIADRTKGGGTLENRAKRLARRYSEKYPAN